MGKTLDHAHRGHAVLSASSSKQWLHCTPSARLQENIPNPGSVYAREGTHCHEITEAKLRSRYFHEDVKQPKDEKFDSDEVEQVTDACYEFCAQIIEELKSSGVEPIVRLEEKIDYTNIVPDGFGTGDFIAIGVLPDGRKLLQVADYKFGRGVLVDADHNSQIMLYAIGALNRYGYIYDFDVIRMTILQPRLANFSTFEMTQQELLDWAESIRPIAKLAWEGKGEQVPGDWCTFCRVKPNCEARRAEALKAAKEEFADDPDEDDAGLPRMKPPALVPLMELAKSLPMLDRVRDWIESVFSYVSSAAINDGIDIPGYKVVEGRSVRVITDKEKAADRLQKEGYQDIWKPRELMNLTDLEKMAGKKKFAEILEGLIAKPPGKPTFVPESDKRKAIKVEPRMDRTTAEDDFGDLED